MRKLGLARKTNGPQPLSVPYLITLTHPDAALTHVAILGAPATTVVDEHAITALAALDPAWVIPSKRMVADVVPDTKDLTRRGRQHRDVAIKPTHVRQSKVRALMAIVDKPATSIIPGTRPWVHVNVVLDRTDGADFAVYRQG